MRLERNEVAQWVCDTCGHRGIPLPQRPHFMIRR
jgi:hypothetical protein